MTAAGARSPGVTTVTTDATASPIAAEVVGTGSTGSARTGITAITASAPRS
jgi:hypothetical protein